MNNGFNRVLRGYGFKNKYRQQPSMCLRRQSNFFDRDYTETNLWDQWLFRAPDTRVKFHAVSSAGWQGPAASANWTHSCAGENRFLLVGVAMRGLDNSPVVASITYNSTNLTKIAHAFDLSGTLRSELWYLAAPATGANVIQVALSAAVISNLGCAGMSLVNVNQSAPLGASAAAAPLTGTSVSTGITTQYDNSMIVDFVQHRNYIDINRNAGQNHNLETSNGTNTLLGFSTKFKPAAGLENMGWSGGADHEWRHILAEIRGTAGGTAARRIFSS